MFTASPTGTPHITNHIPDNEITKILQKLDGEGEGVSDAQIWGPMSVVFVGAAITSAFLLYLIIQETIKGCKARRARRDLVHGKFQRSNDHPNAQSPPSTITGNADDGILTLGQEVVGKSSTTDSKGLGDVKNTIAEPSPAYMPTLR
jgi:hypothetical protein